MKMKFNYFLACIVVVVLAACSHKVKTTTTTTETTPDPVLMATITEGKTLYETNCNKCHELINPGKFTETEWTKNLNWMAPKAKITDTQKQTIFAYLSYNAKHKK